MATKQLETVSGAVQQINAKKTGIKVAGLEEWLNISQFHPIATVPTVGQLVECQFERTDRGVWINSLRIVGDALPQPASSDRDELVTYLACLKAAAIFAGGYAQNREQVKSSDVLSISDAYFAHVKAKFGKP
jgi:hypothetical protein